MIWDKKEPILKINNNACIKEQGSTGSKKKRVKDKRFRNKYSI